MSNLFKYLDLETVSICNRHCPTCIRNSHPNKEATSSWFEYNLLPMETIVEALNQCSDLGFTGGVCLSHYNEPLKDERIAEIARIVKAYEQFHPIYLHTNGDFLTEALANSLDGVLDKILVSLYMSEPKKSERAEWVKSLFHTTYATPLTASWHIATHFSPKFDVKALAESHRGRACPEADIRVIINHRSQFLLCCDDFIGNFNLGYFPETSIKDYWFGKRLTIAKDLREAGGRNKYSYCITCPRP